MEHKLFQMKSTIRSPAWRNVPAGLKQTIENNLPQVLRDDHRRQFPERS
jgi:hypothetical protein